jgi:hypothetical protein
MDETGNPKITRRSLLLKEIQVSVFRRDRWLCRWCGRMVIFAPVVKYVELLVRKRGFTGALAYHDPRWRRDEPSS